MKGMFRTRRTGSVGPLTCAAWLCVTAASPAQTAADLQSARELFTQANDLREAHDLKAALAKYRAAHALANTPVTGLACARAYADLGDLVEAREVLFGVANIPPKPTDSERVRAARAEAATFADALRGRIASLLVVVDGLPAGAVPSVRIDGVAIPADALIAPRKMNPGSHEIVVHAWGASRASQFALTEGETRTLHVEAPPEPDATPATVAPPPSPAVVPPPSAPQPVVVAPAPPSPAFDGPVALASPTAAPPSVARPAARGGVPASAIVVGSLAGASLAVSAITGSLALGKKSDVAAHCNSYGQCDSAGLSAAASGGSLATASTATCAVGVAGIALAIIFGVVGSSSAPARTAFVVAPSSGGTEAVVSGRF